MFFAVIIGTRTKVDIKESGKFFCLQCNAERSFQRRSWEQTRHLFYFPVAGNAGEFVLCMKCEGTFSVACLDETSTADLEELLVNPPDRTVLATRSGGRGSGAYSPARRH